MITKMIVDRIIRLWKKKLIACDHHAADHEDDDDDKIPHFHIVMLKIMFTTIPTTIYTYSQ